MNKLPAATVARWRWIPSTALSALIDRVEPLMGRLAVLVCAHDEIISDSCGKPEHDLCRGCDTLFPGQALWRSNPDYARFIRRPS